ncbi:MAG: amino acid permease [Bradymonadales bacterium]|nr:amino acid permease [Bradymonadales bacterium]
MAEQKDNRTIGLLGATGVGFGAIVGGGILALAGAAFSVTGPGAILAFGLNGAIAILTVLSFAELSTAFPESGGTYTFARKVLSVRSAFGVGWVVWFASIVAGVLYALGFGSFAGMALVSLVEAVVGPAPAWMTGRLLAVPLAMLATAGYTLALLRRQGGGGQWANAGKAVVFAVLLAGGFWALTRRAPADLGAAIRPFFPAGVSGLFTAMGYTFIALQGFDLIAAVAGEIRDPRRVIPRAMFLSEGIALAIYLPFLFILATVGVPGGTTITDLAARQPDALVAVSSRVFLGPFGYWLVIVAGILAMLSGLQANLLGASRVALTMSRDRTLPRWLDRVHPEKKTPYRSILATAAIIAVILLVVPNVAAAGAAASLIFLVTFSLAHLIAILARRRGGSDRPTFRVRWFPLIPVVGGMACLALAIFQGVKVPSAGLIGGGWLLVGGVLFIALFARRARVVDAAAEARDPGLVRLRGRSPLVLVPIANPANAVPMVMVASALAPPEVGRVLLLSVVSPPDAWQPGQVPPQLAAAQAVLRESLVASFSTGLHPEALTTVSSDPWGEIIRVARSYDCESLLIGFSQISEKQVYSQIEQLISSVECDVAILRAPVGWVLSDTRKVLVPLGGRGGHDELRARLLSSLHRFGKNEIEPVFLSVLSEEASEETARQVQRQLAKNAMEEVPGGYRVVVERSSQVSSTILRYASESDLTVLGVRRVDRRQKVFGRIALDVVQQTSGAVILISRRG